ncbi:MAG: hypothetical protein LUM44_02540 [Pyrinomonadaceae bacterium]|nr:hypothetical protein [Pyrinomonadaceae bacterium]
MGKTAPAKIAETAVSGSAVKTLTKSTTSIRVSPNSYFIALFLAAFFSGFFIYLELDWLALSLMTVGLVFLPIFYWTDRIAFDGKRIARTGILPNVWSFLNASRMSLKLSDIEQVETQSLRALKRGGNVFYRYRTAIRGKDAHFAFASGGEDYRQMIARIFPSLSENVLDNRSIELRDYLSEPKETLMKAEFNHIPSAEVLENSIGDFDFKQKRNNYSLTADAVEKSEYLRRLANELRLSGYLLQALESFRRALLLTPQDGWLLFESARCLHSFAGSEKNRKLERKAIAMMQLSEKHADGDSTLLSRLGESYFQFGELERAKSVFQKAVGIAETSFRSARGLAEIALREGKIAHVIHHFSTANRVAETPALRRWTQGETEYFSRLNDDEEYMDLEISRINMLETLENSKRTTLKLALFGFPAILVGIIFDESLIANIGWAVSAVSLLIWAGLSASIKLFADRIPYDLIETED